MFSSKWHAEFIASNQRFESFITERESLQYAQHLWEQEAGVHRTSTAAAFHEGASAEISEQGQLSLSKYFYFASPEGDLAAQQMLADDTAESIGAWLKETKHKIRKWHSQEFLCTAALEAK
ncbi:MAG: hypothetical protein JSS34_08905, partial [Proteobacteria bacterium]|nr:hypothetical protein [Pseudomonadota bacterium]